MVMAMRRDASFWRRPGRSIRFHIPATESLGPFGHPVARCSKLIQLDPDSATELLEDHQLLCKKCIKMAVELCGTLNRKAP